MTKTEKAQFDNIGLTWYPWIGKHYQTGGIFNKKILILGESHYGTEEDKWFNENLTILSIQQKIGEAPGEEGKFYKKAFHTNIFKAFNEKPTATKNLIDFWHSVSFFNYVQGSVGEKARQRPKGDDWSNSLNAVKKTFDILKPEVIVVLGYSLWENTWRLFEHEVYKHTTFNKNHNIHKLKYDYEPLMFCVKHPSGGFSSNYFRPHILSCINEK